MFFYDSKGNIKNIDIGNKFDNGVCAEVFKKNEIVYKKYYPMTSKDLKIKKYIFEYIKIIDNSHIIDLIEYYYLENNNSAMGIDMYSSSYIEKMSDNILEIDKSYVLENFFELEKLIEQFSMDNIMVVDVKANNVIMGENNMVLIDPDLYSKKNTNEEDNLELLTINKTILMCGFMDIISMYSPDYEKGFTAALALCNNLKMNSCITDTISKRLNKYKKIIDYIK